MVNQMQISQILISITSLIVQMMYCFRVKSRCVVIIRACLNIVQPSFEPSFRGYFSVFMRSIAKAM